MSEQTIQQRQKKSNAKLALWTGLWLVSTVLLAFGPKLFWDFNSTASVSALLINLVIGIGMIRANVHHLKSLDELDQRVFLEACAITLGVLMVFGVAYELLSYTEVIAFTPRISHLYFVMGITFITSTFLSHKRYA